MTDLSAPLPEQAPADKAPVAEDFIDIFFAPRKVFARRVNGNWFIPMVVVTVLVVALYFAFRGVMHPVIDAEFQRSMAAAIRKNPQLNPAQFETMRGFAEKFGVLIAFFTMPIVIFFVGLFLWIVGKFFGSMQTLGSALVVSGYASMVKVVQSIVSGIIAFSMDPSQITSRYSVSASAARFVDPNTTAPALLALLGRIDIFTIWFSVLLAIGLAVTGRITLAKAGLAVLVLWLLTTLVTVAGPLLTG